MPGTLYVVATPIGNLEDLTVRAARVLAEVDTIAAESSRTAAKLLRHLGITKRALPYNDRNKARTTGRLIRLLRAGGDVALLSDAGTPGISDPGQDLVEAALAAGIAVVPTPGVSAAATLLSVAGRWGRSVRLLGFLPRKAGERRGALAEIGERAEPTLVFESPHRLGKTLALLAEVLPEARLVVGRELTKLHEEIWRGRPAEACAYFDTPRGEFTLLILPPAPLAAAWSDAEVRAALGRERASGRSRRDAAASVAAASGRRRREVYRLWEDVGAG